ncbi:hypothetical protein GCM10012275_60300 [Longimycelium tulufanense]|uniref:Uncharacterized protein n=1 Tax=Longimycelium tulufanense TaxID=907463 RepID=A0A8J3CIC5_9PSEU|nr:hypothetical protein GCM10012275_60300 [Longimycelium tulufanense]
MSARLWVCGNRGRTAIADVFDRGMGCPLFCSGLVSGYKKGGGGLLGASALASVGVEVLAGLLGLAGRPA